MENKDEEPTIYSMLGITKERGEEITKDILDIMMSADTMPDAFLAIAKKYDTKSILARMRVDFLLDLGMRNRDIKKLTAERQNVPMN